MSTMTVPQIDEMIHVLQPGIDAEAVLTDIAESENQEEAFYVMDVGDVAKKFENWKQKMPDIKPFYAVKCNDSPIILELLAGLGCGFDCASKNEIGRVLDMGVAPERIIFANPVKMTSHIKYASRYGVDLMTFDSVCELHKIRANHANPKLVLRIRVDSNDAQSCLGMKFGCEPSEGGALLKASAAVGLPVVGVSFHVGSGNREAAAWPRAIRAAAAVAAQARAYGHDITLLDIGGGFPGDTGTSILKIAEMINDTIAEEWCDWGDDLRVIAEPGRYFVSSAYTLAACVHSVRATATAKPNVSETSLTSSGFESGSGGDESGLSSSEDDEESRDDDDDAEKVMYYINDGVYGSFNCILFDHAIKAPIALKDLKQERKADYISDWPTGDTQGRRRERDLERCVVWGPTCDSVDMITDRALLPRLRVGDWLVFRDMGAYTLPVATTFNGFPLPRVHHLVTAEQWSYVRSILPADRFTLDAPKPSSSPSPSPLLNSASPAPEEVFVF